LITSSLFHKVKKNVILTSGSRLCREYECYTLPDGSTFLKTVFSHGSTTDSSADLQANFLKTYNTFFFGFYTIQSGKSVVTPHTLKNTWGLVIP